MLVTIDIGFKEKDGLRERIIEICKKSEEKYPNRPSFHFKTKALFAASQLSYFKFWRDLWLLEADKFIIKRYGEVIVPRENVQEYFDNPSEIGANKGI